MIRQETRAERYSKKLQLAEYLPLSMVTVEFQIDVNLGTVVRSCACFGVRDLHVIGHVPDYKTLKGASGSTLDLVRVIQHSTPAGFLQWKRREKPEAQLVSLELTDEATPLHEFKLDKESFVVLGHETTGVPVEILHSSDRVLYIPMHGAGFCLNTGFTGHVFLYEMTRSKSCGQS